MRIQKDKLKKQYFWEMILVTGATGLVGAHLCLRLLQQNQSFVALFRREKKRQSTLDFLAKQAVPASAIATIEWRKADLCTLPELTMAFDGITRVYHCAAYVSMAYFKRHYLTEVNQQGTSDLVNLCIEKKVKKLAYVSSIAALGSDPSAKEINEETPWNPVQEKTPYAYSKYGAELEVWRAAQEGVPVVIVNPGVILGLGMPGSPLALLVRQLRKGMRRVPPGSTGYVAVEDVVDVLIHLMKSDIHNERYILVAENWTYKKMMGFVARCLGIKPPTRPLRSGVLYALFIGEYILSSMGMRKRFLSRALIKSLTEKQLINGAKIKTTMDFDYRPIDSYLQQQLVSF